MSKRESVSEYIFSPFEMYDKPEWLPQKKQINEINTIVK